MIGSINTIMATQKAKKVRLFKDIDMSFGKNDFSNDINKKLDVNAVKQAIKNLLLTKTGERPFNPELGSPLYNMMFEPMRPGIETVISSRVRDVIETYEPRARVMDIETFADYDNNGYRLSLFFHVVGINEQQALHLNLTRLR